MHRWRVAGVAALLCSRKEGDVGTGLAVNPQNNCKVPLNLGCLLSSHLQRTAQKSTCPTSAKQDCGFQHRCVAKWRTLP